MESDIYNDAAVQQYEGIFPAMSSHWSPTLSSLSRPLAEHWDLFNHFHSQDRHPLGSLHDVVA